MKIKALVNMRVNRQHVKKHATLEVDDKLGKRLVDALRATRVGAKDAPKKDAAAEKAKE